MSGVPQATFARPVTSLAPAASREGQQAGGTPTVARLPPMSGLAIPRPALTTTPDLQQAGAALAKGEKDILPGRCVVPSDKAAAALDKVLNAASSQAEARRLGVDLAKADYFNKKHNVAVAVTNFVLTALLTAATGGLAVPLLVLTGVRVMVAAADMACARKSVKDAEYELEKGKPAPDRLPMGSSAIGNLTFWALKGLGVGDDKARLSATAAGCVVSVGLSLSMLFTALYSAPAFAFTEGLCRMGSSVAGGLLGLYEYGYVGFFQAPAQARRLDEVRKELALTQQFVDGLGADDRAWLARQLREIDGEGASKEIDELLKLSAGEWAPVVEDSRKVAQRRVLEDTATTTRQTTRAYFLLSGANSVVKACLRAATLA